ncbi:MAG: SpoIVB peptidase [Clostridia bacterium]|nr:SpoIVB peptidase [Clostridia bacterium]
MRIYRKRQGVKAITFCLTALILFACAVGVGDYLIPDRISVYTGSDPNDSLSFASLIPNEHEAVAVFKEENREDIISATYTANAFGIIPIKNVEVSLYKQLRLCPGGMPFGVKFYTKGVIVIGTTDVDSAKGKLNPSQQAGIRVKDVITELNGKEVTSAEDVTSVIEACAGETIHLKIERDGECFETDLTPVLSASEQKYKAGIWIRDSTAGIGTVTFINPDNNTFAGLGHGICDVDTGTLMPLQKGIVTDVTISGITKGTAGAPGELKGYFGVGKTGALLGNTNAGVFGLFNEIGAVNRDDTLPIALCNEVHEGPAEIRCTLDGNTVGSYKIEIMKINPNENDLKNFVIRVNDETLLDKTGGIVQGMSGSPIIQDGKIVGAVTHVLINDPTKGYGIFIENMLEAAG